MADYLQLAGSDPVMAGLVERIGRRSLDQYPWGGGGTGDGFAMLVRTIAGQQVSNRVAEVFSERITRLSGGEPTPAQIAALEPEALRGIGLSQRKAEYIQGLAAAIVSGKLDLAGLTALDDAEVERRLTALRGIGPWSAHMYLMFHLRRPDVFPAGDLVIQVAVRDLYGLPDRPKPAELTLIAEAWRPHRTLASIYLWASRGEEH